MLILNEKQYAENIYLGKVNDVKSIVQKAGYVTRYQLYVLGYNDSDNYSYTVRWMNKHHDNFNENCYSKLISDAVKNAHKRPFFDVGSLKITKSELDIISSLNNLRVEKILFVLLCMAKQQSVAYGFTNGLVVYSLPELFKTARISIPTDEREYVLYEAVKRGCLDYPKKNDTSCLKVNFIDDSEEVVLVVDDVDCKELAYVYLNWKNNGGYDKCESCGRLFRKSRYRKYCHECAKYQPTGDKIVICVDCGQEFTVDARNMTKCRCDDCQVEYRRKWDRERKRKLKE